MMAVEGNNILLSLLLSRSFVITSSDKKERSSFYMKFVISKKLMRICLSRQCQEPFETEQECIIKCDVI